MIQNVDTVLIEVPSAKVLNLRGNPMGLERAKNLPLINWNYSYTEIYRGQTSYFNKS